MHRSYESKTEKKLMQRTLDPKAAGGNSELRISFPKLQLQTFDGNLLQWQKSWDTFKAAADQQNLPSVAKFSYLKSALKGAAVATISGVSVNNENYDMAILLIRDRFGRPEKIFVFTVANLTKVKQ